MKGLEYFLWQKKIHSHFLCEFQRMTILCGLFLVLNLLICCNWNNSCSEINLCSQVPVWTGACPFEVGSGFIELNLSSVSEFHKNHSARHEITSLWVIDHLNSRGCQESKYHCHHLWLPTIAPQKTLFLKTPYPLAVGYREINLKLIKKLVATFHSAGRCYVGYWGKKRHWCSHSVVLGSAWCKTFLPGKMYLLWCNSMTVAG